MVVVMQARVLRGNKRLSSAPTGRRTSSQRKLLFLTFALSSAAVFLAVSFASQLETNALLALDTVVVSAQRTQVSADNSSGNPVVAAKNDWSDLKVAVYMTTHWSDQHVAFLKRCWDAATSRYSLLSDAHLILYTSQQPDPDVLKLLHFQSITVKVVPQPTIPSNATDQYSEERKQLGAKKAMVDLWFSEDLGENQSWFDGYDWVIRLNPDVLIRNDTWFKETMLNDAYDLIAVDYPNKKGVLTPYNLHTDFYAFRPQAVDFHKLRAELNTSIHAERHLGVSFVEMRLRNRTAWIPGVKRKRWNARVLGQESPVIHLARTHRKLSQLFQRDFRMGRKQVVVTKRPRV